MATTLPVDGNVPDGWELNSSGATIARDAAPPLADSNDLTWFENATTGPLDYNVRIATLAGGYNPASPVTLHIRLSVSTDLAAGTDATSFLFLQDGNPTDTTGDFYVGQFTNAHWNVPATIPAPFDGTPRDLTLSLIPRPAGTGAGYGVAGKTLADCLAILASGDAWLNVNTLQANDGDNSVGRVYEAWLEVGTQSGVYPLRRYPPVNNGGSGPTRHWPRTVNRRAGGTY